MRKKILIYSLAFILCLDLGYSFLQYYYTPLDGDMAGGIVPNEGVKKILEDPIGLSVLTDNAFYPNPNRFFSHLFFYEYYRNIPLFIQNFTNPINSIYLSTALAKIIIHILILFLLAAYISGTRNFLKKDFLISAVLITPLFQTHGYRSYMGIIDESITYSFFYALPIGLLLLFYLPFFKNVYHNDKMILNISTKLLMLILAIIVTLSGPLNPGVVLIVTLLIFMQIILSYFKQSNKKLNETPKAFIKRKIRRNDLFLLLPISVLSVYSLYIGSFNSISLENSISFVKSFSKLPDGVYYQFTQKLGFPILFLMVAINTFIIHKYHCCSQGQKILQTLKWIGIFALIYIILLPFGGYREYRQNILRYDTIMPITISLIFIYGASTLFLIKRISKINRKWYLIVIIGAAIIFTSADKPDFNKNYCERQALNVIANSTENLVILENDCNVLSWKIITTPEDSKLNAELLKYWNVINERKLYFNKMSVTHNK